MAFNEALVGKSLSLARVARGFVIIGPLVPILTYGENGLLVQRWALPLS